MTFLASISTLVGCAAAIFFIGLLAVHFSLPRDERLGLWHTFWAAVVVGTRHDMRARHAAHARSRAAEPAHSTVLPWAG